MYFQVYTHSTWLDVISSDDRTTVLPGTSSHWHRRRDGPGHREYHASDTQAIMIQLEILKLNLLFFYYFSYYDTVTSDSYYHDSFLYHFPGRGRPIIFDYFRGDGRRGGSPQHPSPGRGPLTSVPGFTGAGRHIFSAGESDSE